MSTDRIVRATAGLAIAALALGLGATDAVAATQRPAAAPSAAALRADVRTAIRADEYLVTDTRAAGDHTVEFRTVDGTVARTLRLTSAATTELVEAWKDATVRHHVVTPQNVNRQTCDNGDDQTMVFNYNYTGVLCFGVGGGNVAVYEINQIAADSHYVQYDVNGERGIDHILPTQTAYFNASQNVELTYLNVES